jgi:hypothetical protein
VKKHECYGRPSTDARIREEGSQQLVFVPRFGLSRCRLGFSNLALAIVPATNIWIAPPGTGNGRVKL